MKKLVLACSIALPVAASAVVATGWMSSRPVGSVRVVGEFSKVSSKALRARVMQAISGGFFGVDVDAVRAAALELPFVREVTVRRVWPDSIHIAVVERRAFARWNGDALMESDGNVFRPRHRQGHAELPLLQGPEGTHRQVFDTYASLAADVVGFAGGLRRVSLSERGAWELEFASGLTLVPDSPLDVDTLMRTVSLLPRLLGDELAEVARIDLRYPNGFAVRWRSAGSAGTAGSAGVERRAEASQG
jgi:cell division protein FtsQ